MSQSVSQVASATPSKSVVGHQASSSSATFIENFQALADADGGVEHLRGLVIELAVRGRLTEQDRRDQPANTLLARAESVLGKGRTRRVLSVPIATPATLPSGWVWCEPQDLGIVSPRNDTRDSSEVGFVPMAVVPTDYRRAVVAEVRIWSEIKKGYTHVADGDIAVAKITPCFQNGKSCVMAGLMNGIGAGTTELLVLRPVPGVVEPKYLLLFYKSPDFIGGGVARMTGTAGQQRVPAEYFAAAPLPLPPLAEQKRIVAKVDQLMALCDELESRQARKREVGARLTTSALEALTSAEGPEEFERAWGRVRENFGVLIGSSQDVTNLRSAIRDLAITGRLLPSVCEQRNTSLRTDGAFAIPARWQWSPLGDLAQRTDYGTSQKAHEQPHGVAILRMNNLQEGRLDLSSLKYVPQDTERLEELMLLDGDLLFNRTNSYELVGKMATFREAKPYTFASYLIRVRLTQTAAIPEYINLYFGSATCRRTQIEPHITRQTNQANFNGTKLKGIAVPIPPLEEQKRIVAKVEHLMSVCDALEAHLRRAEEKAAKLAEAVVQEMVA